MGSASLSLYRSTHNQWDRPVFHSTVLHITNGIGRFFTLLQFAGKTQRPLFKLFARNMSCKVLIG